MKKLEIQEDFEREYDKDSVYLYEKEVEEWMWWHKQWRREEGVVDVEGIEEEELTELLPF